MPFNTRRLSLVALTALTLVACSDDPASGDPGDPGNGGATNVRVAKDVELSAQASTVTGHYYDVEADTTYAMHSYSVVAADIDLVYYVSSVDQHGSTLTSPDNEILMRGSYVGNYSGYVTEAARALANNTELRKIASMTAAQFDAVNDSAAIASAFAAAGSSGDAVNNLAENDVVGFRTNEGTTGLLLVTEIFPKSAAGTITFTVKTKK